MPRGLLALVATAWLSIIGASPEVARADQKDPRLNALFERLRATPSDAEAKVIEQQIWQIWGESDDDAVGRLMQAGVVAMVQQEYGIALESFDQLVKQAPDFAEGWNKRATVYYLMGNFPASVSDIERTLQLEPRHFGALSGLGLIYDAIEEPAAALRSFEAALAIDPHLDETRQRVKELRQELAGRRT
jgi:tetratricopeptide (TPR) repeat protein